MAKVENDIIEFNPVANPSINMLDDLNSLEDIGSVDGLDFGETAQDAVDEVQENCDISKFMYNVESLLPDFNTYFNNNKSKYAELILDASRVADIFEESAVLEQQGLENFKFKNDDEIIETINGYLTLDILTERITQIKEAYRNKLIALHQQSQTSGKVLDLPVITITRRDGSAKTEVSTPPKEFLETLSNYEMRDKFLAYMSKLDWGKTTKSVLDKIVSVMKQDKEMGGKDIYTEMKSHDIVIEREGSSSYTIASKMK